MKAKLFLVILMGFSFFVNMFAQKENAEKNPYYFPARYYNPQQIDFSKDFWDYLLRLNNGRKSQNEKIFSYNCDSIWQTIDRQQNGVLGENYQRIQFYISGVSRNMENSNLYYVVGKSKVNNNICDFSGIIKLLKLFYYKCDYDDSVLCGNLIGKYIFYEDSTQNHSGKFEGIMDCDVFIDKKNKRIILDESMEDADGYSNRTFVGIWTNYKTQQTKKCLWGDYRLPFVFNFDCGDGEMIICDEYEKNGWKSFNDGSEYVQRTSGKWSLKDKWWKR